jgi:hypothetical protein
MLFTYSPEAPLTNELVTFTSTVEGAVSQQWALDPDGVCNDGEGATVQRSFPLAGGYWIRLCVSDGNTTWSNTQRVTIHNRPPGAAFMYGPTAPLTGDAIAFTSISADPDGPIVSHAWDLDDDGAFDDGSGPTAAWAFTTPGSHPVRLLVADRDGATAVAAVPIVVAERPPEAISPFPLVRVTAALSNRGTRIRELVVRAPPGATVRVRCRGRHCPFRPFARKTGGQVRAARTVRIHRLRRYLLRPGTRIEIRVTKRGEVGKYTRFRIRKGKPPVRVDRCLEPGGVRPVRCPSA